MYLLGIAKNEPQGRRLWLIFDAWGGCLWLLARLSHTRIADFTCIRWILVIAGIVLGIFAGISDSFLPAFTLKLNLQVYNCALRYSQIKNSLPASR
ncbi:hypothetical protein [Butyrivibrio hungatei]|uniref:hypothetical protein n=1 Tax=Butyrivibrio hungatei TaxID=185008 RepID=UPI000933D0BD|nr:hypothetical protein [Butyrivibrio hungatei]